MRNKNLKENLFLRSLLVPFRGIYKTLFPISYVKHQYHYITHHKLNLDNPIRYTEKLQYLRLFVYPKDLEVSKCAGRVGVREYVSSKGYTDNLIEIYGVFDKFKDIDFSKLPNSFVLKTTHSSQMNYIVYDKNKINLKALEKLFNKYLKIDYGKKTLEKHYSPIKPQIIIEKLMLENDSLPKEYKIHCYNGKAKNLYVVTNRNKDIRYSNFYIDWTPFDGSQFNGWKTSENEIKKPSNFDDMIKISEDLAGIFPFVRVDLYNINGKIYFSELTFTPAKGTLIFDDDKCDFEMGEWLDISKYFNAK